MRTLELVLSNVVEAEKRLKPGDGEAELRRAKESMGLSALSSKNKGSRDGKEKG